MSLSVSSLPPPLSNYGCGPCAEITEVEEAGVAEGLRTTQHMPMAQAAIGDVRMYAIRSLTSGAQCEEEADTMTQVIALGGGNFCLSPEGQMTHPWVLGALQRLPG